MNRNPFVFDRPVTATDLVDRERELGILLDNIDNGVNTRLSGPRDYGKTSLLRRVLADVEKRDMVPVYVDVDDVRNKGELAGRLNDGYQHLSGKARRIYNALRTRGGHITAAGFGVGVGGSSSASDDLALEQTVRDLLNLPTEIFEKYNRRVVIVFDEFQAIFEARLEGTIRSVIQHQSDAACYLFSGSHPGMMRAMFSDQRRPFYGQAAPLVLQQLPQLELGNYIAERFEETKRDPGEPLIWLLELVDGHPQRAMLLAHLLWAETHPGATADSETWARVLDAAWGYVREPFVNLWSSLTPIKRSVIEAVARNQAGLTARYNRDHFGIPAGSAAATAARSLADTGTLVEEDDSPTGYRLVDPLLARWVTFHRRWPTINHSTINA